MSRAVIPEGAGSRAPSRRHAVVRPLSSRGRHAALSPAKKLAFVESLLASETLMEAAQLGVDWLTRHAGVQQALLALVDLERAGSPERPATGRLVGAASYGLDPVAVGAVSIDLEDREHPLVAALAAEEPVPLAAAALSSLRLSFKRSCVVYPLPFPLDPERESVAVVALSGRGDEIEIRWLFRLLGRKLLELRNLRVLASTERRLDRERALLQSILKAVPDPVLLTDPEGRLVLANARAEMYLASEEEESEGRRRAVALNNMLFSAALTRHAIEGAELARRELPLVEPSDGSDRLFELMSAPIVTPDGPGVVSVMRNVTDLQLAAQEIEENYRRLRLAEAEVRAERDRLDVVIDSVADPIVVTDANGATIMTNPPAERLFTADPEGGEEELHRVRSNDAHFSSHVSNLFFSMDAERFRGELGLTDPKTGALVPVEAISGKILNDSGEVTALVTILHDLTEAVEKARLYEELKRASDLLEQKVRDATAELVRQNELLQRQAIALEAASSAKSQFLANMSHEFRTPLNAILGYTSMLLQGVWGELPPPVVRQLTRVDSNAKHLLTIINDILDISRIEAGKMPLHLERVDVAALVREVLAELDPLVARTTLTVKSELDRKLRPVRTDRAKVKQILVNLISNALKFTPKGSVTVSAQLRTPAMTSREPGQRPDSERKSDISISVADTGIGISDVDRESVFQDFRQVDNSPTRPYGGTGLGLAICRRLAKVLGGEIELASEVGRGSTFTLVLPAKRGAR